MLTWVRETVHCASYARYRTLRLKNTLRSQFGLYKVIACSEIVSPMSDAPP